LALFSFLLLITLSGVGKNPPDAGGVSCVLHPYMAVGSN
jgi:hypothetical protein